MQPLGYYGLNLDSSVETAIDSLPLHELTDLLTDAAYGLNHRHYTDNDDIKEAIESKPLDTDRLKDIDKLALIRGLCDRIETKLMEVAK